jgi:hypothetical protein
MVGLSRHVLGPGGGAGPSNGDRFGWFNGGSLGRPKRGRDVQRSHQKVDAGTASRLIGGRVAPFPTSERKKQDLEDHGLPCT